MGPQKAGIEIMSQPSVKVFLDDREAGMTPYKNSSLKPGEVKLKLVPENGQGEWSKTVYLPSYINTVIEREFKGESSGGYTLSMERTGDENKAGIIVNALPNNCAVSIDGEIKGFTPLKIDSIGEGDKQVTISFPGHRTVNVFIKSANGFRIIIESDLYKEPAVKPLETTERTLENREENVTAEPKTTLIKIKETETGWLRVRDKANSSGQEVAKVNPGEKYKLIKEEAGWYQLELKNGATGWISGKYAEKVVEQN